ncbi:MAG TPA: ABC transporter substrate-binding protein, partial [Quisquiliibacterium sp.]|nr:ABC transporter substrate-binding protein [Quisquiliibacterium sp.]
MTSRRTFILQTAAGSAAILAGTGVAHATQGVSKDQVVIGTIQDLSGPLAVLGKPVQNGMILRTEQINASGGIQGRKLKVVLEDSGYDPK